MTLPRLICGLAVLTLAAVSSAGVQAQETLDSAAQRPLVPIPEVKPPERTAPVPFPRWSEFPTPPQNVPTVQEIARRVSIQKAAADQLDRQVRALTWDNEEPEPYAEAARGRINPAYLRSVDPYMSVEQIEALGAELRRRALPPPIADM